MDFIYPCKKLSIVFTILHYKSLLHHEIILEIYNMKVEYNTYYMKSITCNNNNNNNNNTKLRVRYFPTSLALQGGKLFPFLRRNQIKVSVSHIYTLIHSHHWRKVWMGQQRGKFSNGRLGDICMRQFFLKTHRYLISCS